MKAKKWLTTAVSVTLVGALAAGCSSGGSSSTSTPAPTGSEAPAGSATPAPKSNKPQELKMTLTAEPPALDISKATTVAAANFSNAINEGLFRMDKEGKIQPAVAKAPAKKSADGKTYTIDLKENTTWSDGKPVTAHDFVYSYQRTIDPATKSQYSFMMEFLENGADITAGKKKPEELAVKALSDYQIEIKLANPMPFFEELLAFPTFLPQREDMNKQWGDKIGADADKTISNGPFKLTSWNHEQNLTLEKNDKYWDAANVQLTKVTFNIIKDAATGLNLFETNAADYVSITGDNLKLYEGKPEVTNRSELTNMYLMFQQKKQPALANVKIRQALTMAIDRQAFVDTNLKNGSVPSTGLVPNGTKDGNGGDFRAKSGDIQPKYDPAKAKQLFEEGLKELNMDKLPAMKLMADDNTGGKKSVEFILNQWKENLGYEAIGDPIPHAARVENQNNHNFDIVVALWGADYNDASTFLDMWYTGSTFNEVDWENAKYTELVKGAQAELDTAKRAQMLADAEKILMEEMPIGPIYFRSAKFLIKTNVKDLVLAPFGFEFELKYAHIE